MKKLSVSLIVMTLSGCASLQEVSERHPIVTRIVEGSLVLCAVGALADHGHERNEVLPAPGINPPNCANGGCK